MKLLKNLSIIVTCCVTILQSRTVTANPPNVSIASVRDLGAVGMPPNVTARDGGSTAWLGDKILWTFGDTLFSPASDDGVNLRSSTAALADPDQPTHVSEPLDSHGAPYPFLAFTPDEQQYNATTARPDDRIALWPGSVITDDQGNGLVFYNKLKVKPGLLNYEHLGIGLAHINAHETRAVRDTDLLFSTTEPSFLSAVYVDDWLYVYGNVVGGDLAVVVARVPFAQVQQRAAYRFWNGSTWDAEVTKALPVLKQIPGGLTVSYNPYLKTYLCVYSEVFSNRILLQTSATLQGPWSEPIEAFTGQNPDPGSVDYAGIEHPELSSKDGKTIVVSYYHPQGGFKGELRLVAVTFR